MNIINKQIKELKAAVYNPRKISDKELKKLEDSLEKFGYVEPVIWNKKTGNVVGGHQRLKILSKKFKPEHELEVVEVDLDEFQEKSLNLALNKISGEWDDDKLKGLIKDLKKGDEAILNFSGFNEAEIKRLLEAKPEDPVKGDKKPKYKIKLGDLYVLGDHKLICADSTSSRTYERLIGDDSVALVYTDPPYGVSYSGTNNPNGKEWDVIKGDAMRGDELYALLSECFTQVNEYLEKDGALYVFHASSNQMIFENALNEAGFIVKQQLIWQKHHVLGHSHYHWSHEPIFYCNRMGENPKFYGDRINKTTLNKLQPEKMTQNQLIAWIKDLQRQSTVWNEKKDSTKDYIHPTQKPVDMAANAIINSSVPSEGVLDPFAGSGSTLMACEETKRKCYAIELDPAFCSHIIERWETKTGRKAEKVSEKEESPVETEGIVHTRATTKIEMPDY